jgi:hypothetical protein
MPAKLLLIDRTNMTVIRCDAQRAEQLMNLDAEQILWCIEEYSRCDVTNVSTNTQYTAINEEYLP